MHTAGTLLGAAKIVRRHCAPGGTLHVSAYVSHFVATYDRTKVGHTPERTQPHPSPLTPTPSLAPRPHQVAKFVDKLYAVDAPLDEFHCSDSIPTVVQAPHGPGIARAHARAPRHPTSRHALCPTAAHAVHARTCALSLTLDPGPCRSG